MSANINDIIRHLLMEEDQVCLPGIGTLRLQPQPALLSSLEGKASPPSELVSFNANLVLDDGRIVREIEDTGLYSREDAVLLLEAYLRNLKENLDAGRSVTLDEIGRLFKHHDGQLRFTPAGANFSKDSFGLPAVELRPIVRTEKQRRAASDPMLGSPTIVGAETTTERLPGTPWEEVLYHPRLRTILWYVTGVLAILLVLAAVYRLAQYGGEKLVDDPNAPVATAPTKPRPQVPADRINVAPRPKVVVPSEEVAPDEPPRLGDAPLNQEPTRTAPPTERPAATPDRAPASSPKREVSPPATANTGNNVALIATGLFGSQRNVTKNIDRIKAAGFTSFSRPEGRLTRIGARVEYRTEGELRTTLDRIRRLYSDAYVMEVNGEEQRIE